MSDHDSITKSIPLVSVVIPTYNSSAFLKEAIDSVLAQTYPAVEVVVINDGSTDDTAELMASYGSKIVGITQKNAGTSASRNTGVAAAKGDYIAFLDHDDLWHKDKLERQMPQYDQFPDLGMVYCGRQFFNHYTKEVTSKHPANPKMDIHGLLALEVIALQTAVIPRHVFEILGDFDVNVSGADDWEICLRISSKYKIMGLPDVLVDIRGHENQQGIQSEYMFSKITAVLEKYRNIHPNCPECKSASKRAQKSMNEAFYQRMRHQAIKQRSDKKYFQAIRSVWSGLKRNPSAVLRVPKRIIGRFIAKPGKAG